MVTMTNEKILEAISQKSVMDVVELVKMMEEKFGVSAAAAVVAGVAPAAAAGAEVEEKTSFNLMLNQIGTGKVSVIKAVREITALGLKEAKDLVDGAPSTIKADMPKAEAEEALKKLVDAGATAELA